MLNFFPEPKLSEELFILFLFFQVSLVFFRIVKGVFFSSEFCVFFPIVFLRIPGVFFTGGKVGCSAHHFTPRAAHPPTVASAAPGATQIP